MQPKISIAVVVLTIFVVSGHTYAQDSPPEVESDFQLNTYHQASTPDDGFILDHAAVLKSLQFGFNLLAQFDDDPLTRQTKNSDGGYTETIVLSERLIVLHAGAAIGFFDYAQLAVGFPIYLDRGTSNSNGGVGDLRLTPKGAVRLPAGKAEFGIAALFPLMLPTGDAKYLTGEGSFSMAPTAAFDMVLAKLRIIVNIGYFWRKEVTEDLVRGGELLLGLGAELDIFTHPSALTLLLETDLSTQTSAIFEREATPACLLGGLKFRLQKGFGFKAAAGAGLTAGVGSPDFRFIFGVDYIWQKPEKQPEEKQISGGRIGDSDGDGIFDDEDSCPSELEDFDKFDDTDGCPEPDNDGDGILDGKDLCPNTSENFDGIEDDDGCPETDYDADNIPDSSDACPSQPEDHDGYEDHDGCPEADNDIDGILDNDDGCPNLPETFNDIEDDDGCPDYFRLVGDRLEFKRQLRFHRKTSDLTDESYEVLEELTASIISNPGWNEISIIAHTSGRGKAEAAQQLSEQRAITILRLLVSSGVIPERLVATGNGNSNLLEPPDSSAARRKNERVEFIITRGGAR
jgi:outer membrane protein OmpA-like peptidoglycan-associated protein